VWDEFVLYFRLGLEHVLDINGYDHVLFLMALLAVFSFKNFKQVIWLVSLFTLGHTLSLAASAYGVVSVNVGLVEWLIPLTIAITCVSNWMNASKPVKAGHLNVNVFYALGFGLVHGLGFSNYFRMIIGRSESKLLPLIDFALGIEAAQVIVVLGFLGLWYLFEHFMNVKRRDWILVISSMTMGVVVPMLIERWPY
jgi:hypothetical protein